MKAPELDHMAQWILWASFSGSVLAILVSLAQRVLGRILSARWGYALWCLVLIRLLLPYSPASELSLFNLGASNPPLGPAPPLSDPPTVSSPEASVMVPLGRPDIGSHERWWPYLWLTGAVAFLGLSVGQQLRLARRLAMGSCGGERLQGLIDGERRKLGIRRPVMGRMTDLVSTPALFGWWRPRLLMPRLAVAESTPAELSWVIRHELAHVRRHDVLLNWVLIGAQALHWFNPVVWWALRRLRAERELVCDGVVVKGLAPLERQAYGSLLIRLADGGSPFRLLLLLTQQQNLKRRIAMIAEPHRPRYAWLFALGLGGTLACLTFTRAAETPTAKDEPPAKRSEEQLDTDVLEELKKELAKLDAEIQVKQSLLAAEETKTSRLVFSQQLRSQLEGQLVEANLELRQMELTLGQLRKLPKSRLRQTVLTIQPDAQLQSLLESESKAKQQLAQMMDSYTETHPEVKSIRRTLETINQQIEDRIDGILLGLETKLDLARARSKQLTMQLDEVLVVQREAADQTAPAMLQLELATLKEFRNRVHKRVLMEELNLSLPPSARFDSAPGDTLLGVRPEQIEEYRKGLIVGRGQGKPAEASAAPEAVNVLGLVNRPGRFPLEGGSRSLVDVLALAGGPAEHANLRQIKVMRPGNSGSRQVFILDAKSMLVDPKAPVFEVRPGDTVYIERAGPF